MPQSLARVHIHLIFSTKNRQPPLDDAVREAVRVLRPGGRLLIADVRGTRQYELHLRKIGMNEVARRRLGQFGWGGAAALVPLVTATKPA